MKVYGEYMKVYDGIWTYMQVYEGIWEYMEVFYKVYEGYTVSNPPVSKLWFCGQLFSDLEGRRETKKWSYLRL